jgi:hypothetical protein
VSICGRMPQLSFSAIKEARRRHGARRCGRFDALEGMIAWSLSPAAVALERVPGMGTRLPSAAV